VLTYPPTPSGAFGIVSTAVALRAGYNIIRLAKCAPGASGGGTSPGFTCGAGSVDLDYLELF
jgi:hypothetical protein